MIKRVSFVLAFLVLGACASAPRLDFTIATPIVPITQPVGAKLTSVSVDPAPGAGKKEIQADQLAFPLWKESLSSALSQAKVFDSAASAAVKIQVTVSKVNAPEFGIEMVTTSTAKYDVIDAASGAVLFSKTVDARGAVPGDYAFAGYVRAQESVNRSVRQSISDFVEALKAAAPTIKVAR
jgi:hypothetical protein